MKKVISLEKKGRVEAGLEIFEIPKFAFNLEDFKDSYRSDMGMDLTKGIRFLNFEFDLNSMIGEFFK